MQQLSLKRRSAKLQSSKLNFNPWKSTEENNKTICKHPQENKVATNNMDCQGQTVSNQSDLPLRQGNWPCGQGKSSRWFDFTSLSTLLRVTFFITQGNIVQMKLLQNECKSSQKKPPRGQISICGNGSVRIWCFTEVCPRSALLSISLTTWMMEKRTRLLNLHADDMLGGTFGRR